MGHVVRYCVNARWKKESNALSYEKKMSETKGQFYLIYLILCGFYMFFSAALCTILPVLYVKSFWLCWNNIFLAVYSCNSPFATLDWWNISHVGVFCKDVRKFCVCSGAGEHKELTLDPPILLSDTEE